MPERFGADCMSQTETLRFEHRLLGMSSFQSGQPHVAQQSRRDRLRYPPVPVPEAPSTHFADLPHHSDPTIAGPIHVVDCQAMYSPGIMIDFSTGAQAGTSVSSISQNPSLCSNLLFAAAAAAAAASQVGNNVQNSSLWKSGHSADWSTMNCGYQDLSISSSMNHSSNAVVSTQQGQSQFGEILPLGSSATPDHGGLEVASFDRNNNSIPWIGGGGNSNELALLPSYSSPSSKISDSAVWMPRETQQQWSSGSCEGDSSARGLSLSLSSKLPPDPPLVPYAVKFGSEAYPLNSIPSGVVRDLQNTNSCISYYKTSNNLTSSGRSLLMQSVVGLPSTDNHRGVGPLGPFTGYATILSNSKYLKPTLQLLVESCSPVIGTLVLVDPPEKCRMPSAHHRKAESHKSAAADDVVKCGGNLDTSSFVMHGSNGPSCEGTGGCVGGGQFCDPQIQQKKAKLLFMQGEICRRQKHYNQQMQMAMSSFESVAGLSAAMPFLSLALKSIVKHFRFLKSVISEQLLDTRRVLGEESKSSPSYSKAEGAVASGLKFFDQTIRKQIDEANGLGLLEHGQPVWRPQRGLPERAVAVLRAWLFDHFLHPYPTDTDKHILATQTGLSRNQVSNWFINARVRVWKPMVEEIHMLETKGLADVDLNSSKNDTTLASGAINSERTSLFPMNQQEHHHDKKLSDCSDGDCLNVGQWHPEKRTRMEHFNITEDVDGGITGFSTYPTGFDMSELGGVSLTLGLRHEEGTQHQQQIRSCFGSQLVQEFVG